MTGWFTFCGFDKVTEKLVFEEHASCDADAVKAALSASDIVDDPMLLNCYPLSREAVSTLTRRDDLPVADYFVNATTPLGTAAS